jgi:hypothetical protein
MVTATQVREPRDVPASMVYIIEAVGSGLVKIGRSRRNPYVRILELGTGAQFPLRILATIAGGHAAETELHRRFAAHRSHREWFFLEPIRADIATLETIVIADWRPRCSDCGGPVSSRARERCRPCTAKRLSAVLIAKWEAVGLRRPRCVVCDKTIPHRSKRCSACVAKLRGERGGPARLVGAPCLDCRKPTSSSRYKRCPSCAAKRRRPRVASARLVFYRADAPHIPF